MAAGPMSTPSIEPPKPSGTPRMLTRLSCPGLSCAESLGCSIRASFIKKLLLNYNCLHFPGDNLDGLFRRRGEVQHTHVPVAYDQMLLPALNDRLPALAQQHKRARLYHARLNLVPDE